MEAETFAWILKTEPETYGWSDMLADGEAVWDGVRNYAARNFMQQMKPGQETLIYHSGKKREIVGIAQVSATAYPDPTDPSGKFVAVKLKPLKTLANPISLSQIKQLPAMANSLLLRQGRLSVIPISKAQYTEILDI